MLMRPYNFNLLKISKCLLSSSSFGRGIKPNINLALGSSCEQILSHKSFHLTSLYYGVTGQVIKMPSLSPTMLEGTIVKWLKQEGDAFQPGDILCEIQTDKAVVALETEEEGILAKILIANDSKDVKVGTIIALMVDEGEDWRDVEVSQQDLSEEGGVSKASSLEKTATTGTSDQCGTHQSFGPSVRLLLEKYGMNPNEVTAGGPHGRLLKGDILKSVKDRGLSPKYFKAAPMVVPESPKTPQDTGLPHTNKELSNMRKTIAKRLTQSKSGIAHTYCTMECNIDNVLDLRKVLKAEGVSISVNDVIIKCVAQALQLCPKVNCTWQGEQLMQSYSVDISVAVATESGLITPIVRNANNLGLSAIADTVADLAQKARNNKLKPEEFIGGTFTISNLGMYGITEFSAIINPPQCAILAVGGGRQCIGMTGESQTLMRSTLSYDQSAIADDTAAQFMQTLQHILQSPNSVLLGAMQTSNIQDHPMAALL